MNSLEALFTPADFALLPQRDLSATVCVVFDVLRATSTVITALANGANAVIPVAEIPEALAIRRKQPDVLLAGERDGVRIPASLTGSIPFDLGNSPREFTQSVVAGKTIVTTTTNGTRALRACAKAQATFAAAFLNLGATAERILQLRPTNLLLVCSGTYEQAALEDILAAGALADLVWPQYEAGDVADTARAARDLYRLHEKDLCGALGQSKNGRRLLTRPDLKDDVEFCSRIDQKRLVVKLSPDGQLRPD